jgi:hypothetical protein
MFQFSLVKTTDDQFVTVFVPGRDPLPANSSHPNFRAIVAACAAQASGEDVNADEVADLFDIPATIQRKFQRLSERVSVEGNHVLLDGDPVHNTLTEQILAFMDEGEDFDPLVNFYEKMLTNPIGDVREGLYDWIAGQTSDGSKVTITEDGDLVGYKGVWPAAQKGAQGEGYVPSRSNTTPIRVNDETLPIGAFAVQNAGDTVEMPRAQVSEPSYECGVGLHIGTATYARSFGPVLLKVKFSPRDVVSAPDANASWKLRVCRYTVLEVIEDGRSHDASVYRPEPSTVAEWEDDEGFDLDFDLD